MGAITTTAIHLVTATTTMRTTTMATTLLAPHSNTISDVLFYGIIPVKVLVLKRFIPSEVTKISK